MNRLEKLFSLLSVDGRNLKYGVLADETADPIVTISTGDSGFETAQFLGDSGKVDYSTVIVSVYSTVFMVGFNLLEQIKLEIKAVEKVELFIQHMKDSASAHDKDKDRYIFKSHYRIIN